MKIVSTNNALKPSGHYSQAIVHNDIVYVSGQLAVNPETGELMRGTVEEEARIVLNNLRNILIEAGSDIDEVLKTVIYIPDIKLWDKVNDVYAEFFGEHRPARAIVPTNTLHFGLQIEMEAIAAVKK